MRVEDSLQFDGEDGCVNKIIIYLYNTGKSSRRNDRNALEKQQRKSS